MAVVLTLGAAPVAAQDGTASGTLTLNGSPVTLAFAYASAHPGFFDKATEDIRILLSDVPLSDEEQTDLFAISRRARQGALHVVEVTLNADGSPIGGALYAPVFDGMVSISGMHRFEPARFERRAVAGRLSMDGPSTFVGVTFQYDAVFSTAIVRAPNAEEIAASLATPAAGVARAHVAALVAGRLDDFRATLAPPMSDVFARPDAADRLARLRADTPADSEVTLATEDGDDAAAATVQGHREGVIIEFTLKLARTGGIWKVVEQPGRDFR